MRCPSGGSGSKNCAKTPGREEEAEIGDRAISIFSTSSLHGVLAVPSDDPEVVQDVEEVPTSAGSWMIGSTGRSIVPSVAMDQDHEGRDQDRPDDEGVEDHAQAEREA